MADRTTSLPIAVTILIILGIVHLLWLGFAGLAVASFLVPDRLNSGGIPDNYLVSLVIVTILSFPFALFIRGLKPRRMAIYLAAALTPTVTFYSNIIIQSEQGFRETSRILIGVTPIFIGLIVALALIHQIDRRGASKNSTKSQRRI